MDSAELATERTSEGHNGSPIAAMQKRPKNTPPIASTS